MKNLQRKVAQVLEFIVDWGIETGPQCLHGWRDHCGWLCEKPWAVERTAAFQSRYTHGGGTLGHDAFVKGGMYGWHRHDPGDVAVALNNWRDGPFTTRWMGLLVFTVFESQPGLFSQNTTMSKSMKNLDNLTGWCSVGNEGINHFFIYLFFFWVWLGFVRSCPAKCQPDYGRFRYFEIAVVQFSDFASDEGYLSRVKHFL